MKYEQKGFTLIEIGIVLFVIGILVAMFVPTFTQGVKDEAEATRVVKLADDFNKFWMTVAQECNLSLSNAIGYVPNSSKTHYDVYNDGRSAVDTPYLACFDRSNVKSVPNAFAPKPGWSSYLIDGKVEVNMFVTVTKNTNKPVIKASFPNLSSSIAIAMLNKRLFAKVGWKWQVDSFSRNEAII